jgi:hypothetical protein
MQERYALKYSGAFAALRISNIDMAARLAELTRTDEEALRVIEIMRTAGEGDRVWPALEWLRMKREVPSGK